MQDLPGGALLVGQEQFAVDRQILLARGVVDLLGREHGVHPERACLIRDDRYPAGTDVLVLQQLFEQAHERHRRGDRLLS